MAWFRCLVRGQNFPLMLEGKNKHWNFYATRFVEAPDEDGAEKKLVALLRADSDIQVPKDVPGRERARIYIEELVEVDRPNGPKAGFTFFDDDGIQFFED